MKSQIVSCTMLTLALGISCAFADEVKPTEGTEAATKDTTVASKIVGNGLCRTVSSVLSAPHQTPPRNGQRPQDQLRLHHWGGGGMPGAYFALPCRTHDGRGGWSIAFGGSGSPGGRGLLCLCGRRF